MAGRGRGRAQVSFNTELLGIGRGGDAAPSSGTKQIRKRGEKKPFETLVNLYSFFLSVLAPPPKYPPRPGRICPLVEGDEQDYLLAVGKEFVNQMRSSQFFIAPNASVAGGAGRLPGVKVERYSDRYAVAREEKLDLNWDRLPRELWPAAEGSKDKKKSRKKREAKPNLAVQRRKASEDVTKTLEELEKKEAGDEKGNEKGNEDGVGRKSGDESGSGEEDEEGGGKSKVDKEGEKRDSDMDEDDDEDEGQFLDKIIEHYNIAYLSQSRFLIRFSYSLKA
jgi:hypothetical protein